MCEHVDTASGTITALTRPQRLAAARQSIAASCAEYNYFRPSSYVTRASCTSCSDGGHDAQIQPPDTARLRTDLQLFSERACALQSLAVDAAYEQISVQTRDAANDEYSGFDWEVFQVIIGNNLKDLQEQSCLVQLSDLATLPMAAAILSELGGGVRGDIEKYEL